MLAWKNRNNELKEMEFDFQKYINDFKRNIYIYIYIYMYIYIYIYIFIY